MKQTLLSRGLTYVGMAFLVLACGQEGPTAPVGQPPQQQGASAGGGFSLGNTQRQFAETDIKVCRLNRAQNGNSLEVRLKNSQGDDLQVTLLSVTEQKTSYEVKGEGSNTGKIVIATSGNNTYRNRAYREKNSDYSTKCDISLQNNQGMIQGSFKCTNLYGKTVGTDYADAEGGFACKTQQLTM